MINKNLSLFTSGISYSTLTNGFGRAFKKGWVSQESFMLDCAGAIVMCVGIASGVAAACMSLGNIRLKKLGNIFFFDKRCGDDSWYRDDFYCIQADKRQ